LFFHFRIASRFFKVFQDAMTRGYYYSERLGMRFILDVTFPADMKAHWTCSQLGGGSYAASLFCHLCESTNDTKHQVNAVRCVKCVRRGRRTCRHIRILTSADYAEADEQVDLAGIIEWPVESDPLEEIIAFATPTLLLTGETVKFPLSAKKTCQQLRDWRVSYFVEKNSIVLCTIPQKIDVGLRLRGQAAVADSDMSFEEKRMELYTTVLFYERLQALLRHRGTDKKQQQIIWLVELMLPCTLHMENRTLEKLLKLLIQKNMFNAGNGLTNKQAAVVLNQIHDLINTEIFTKGPDLRGDKQKETNFKITVENNKVQSIAMNCDKLRSIFAHSDRLLELIFENERLNGVAHLKWKRLIDLYKSIMNTLRKLTDFTDDEIDTLQDTIDDFIDLLVEPDMGGKDSTNYFHLLGSGHITYFLYKHRNLARHANIGWESKNGDLRNYIYRRTQKGGHGGAKGYNMSMARAMLKYMQRKMIQYMDPGDNSYVKEMRERGRYIRLNKLNIE
jgi:hypothetical protein